MKKLSLYIFLVLMWCNVGFADINNKSYCGYIIYYPEDAHTSFKVLANFKINKKNSVCGTYTFEESEKVYEGVFFNGKLEGNILKIFTTDNFGNGSLNVRFDSNFENFTGEWEGGDKDINYGDEVYWDGKWEGEICE